MSFETHLDDRAGTFLQIGDVAKVIAEKHAGVMVDDLTHQRWRQTMALLREADTYADDYDVTDDKVMSALREGAFDNRYPLLSSAELGKAKTDMLHRTELILKLGTAVSRSQAMERFIAHREAEGRETAMYLYDTATPGVRAQEAFHQTFMPTMQSLGVTACLVDSLTDGRMDYKAGKILRRPDAEYYAMLTVAVVRNMKLGAAAIAHLPVMKEFATMSWHRLQNRVTHGRSATSSLKLFR